MVLGHLTNTQNYLHMCDYKNSRKKVIRRWVAIALACKSSARGSILCEGCYVLLLSRTFCKEKSCKLQIFPFFWHKITEQYTQHLIKTQL